MAVVTRTLPEPSDPQSWLHLERPFARPPPNLSWSVRARVPPEWTVRHRLIRTAERTPAVDTAFIHTEVLRRSTDGVRRLGGQEREAVRPSDEGRKARENKDDGDDGGEGIHEYLPIRGPSCRTALRKGSRLTAGTGRRSPREGDMSASSDSSIGTRESA